MKDTLTAKYHINSFDVDQSGTCRLTSIANFLQETAYRHAASLKLGYHDLYAEDRAWVLSRLRISMMRYPKWNEDIRIETWPRGIEKLFGLRDFRILDNEENVIGKADTCWLMVDLHTHRPVRLDPSFIPIETRTDSVFGNTIEKIGLHANMQETGSHRVLYSDLDVVGHVNNVKYIEWCVDELLAAESKQLGPNHFIINFISESKLGDQIVLSIDRESAHNRFIIGKNMSTGNEVYRAMIQLGKRK